MVSANNRCPDEDTLFAFAEGDLDESEAASIQAHAQVCAACRDKLLDAMQSQNVQNALDRNRLNARDEERIRRWKQETLRQLNRLRRDPPGCAVDRGENKTDLHQPLPPDPDLRPNG